MLPRFQSLAFSFIFCSENKSTNCKLFSLVAAHVLTQTKANYDTHPSCFNFLIFQGSLKEIALCVIRDHLFAESQQESNKVIKKSLSMYTKLLVS